MRTYAGRSKDNPCLWVGHQTMPPYNRWRSPNGRLCVHVQHNDRSVLMFPCDSQMPEVGTLQQGNSTRLMSILNALSPTTYCLQYQTMCMCLKWYQFPIGPLLLGYETYKMVSKSKSRCSHFHHNLWSSYEYVIYCQSDNSHAHIGPPNYVDNWA